MFHAERFDTVSSTNDVVKAAIREGRPEGFAALARRQTGGYGRQGRFWESPVGGMYLSALLRPRVAAEQLPTLSLAVGVAVRRALAALLQHHVGSEGVAVSEKVLLKWPNDVVFGASVPFRKLCGISLELIDGAVCVGIGVNVFPPSLATASALQAPASVPQLSVASSSLLSSAGVSQDAPHETSRKTVRNVPAYLTQICSDADPYNNGVFDYNSLLPIQSVADAVLRELETAYTQWQSDGFAPMCSEYESHSALQDRFVTIEARDGALICEGNVQGIDESGRLMIRTRAGKVVHVTSGEAHVRQVGEAGHED